MEFVYLLIGLAACLAAGYLFASSKNKPQASDELLIQELRQSQQQTNAELQNERAKKEELLSQLGKQEQLLTSLQERLNEEEKRAEEMRQRFTVEFQNLANKIFEEKSTRFTQQNKEQIELLLRPFRENLKDFETKVEKVYKEENTERINLKAEIKLLSELNKQISSEANNLAVALKGDNKTQGNWGELVLESILEQSGLREGQEYMLQYSTTNTVGERIRPDVVINLPEQKHIIVDSKVSLNAYTAMISADNDEDRKRWSKAHVESVRAHIKGLGEKNYQTAGNLITPDFVLLFLPIEAAFAAAVQNDQELFNYAWDKKIVLVSPTTLLATLRTVSSIWKQEQRNKNAELIASEAGKMYDKFADFLTDMEGIRKGMKTTETAFDKAMNKLSEGTGNLVTRAEKLRKLGLKTTKEINKNLINTNDPPEETEE
ncbi:MAG: DNA recombination protein RmuC [Flavobacteriales bacterium]